MKRHPSLRDLSVDHHHALVQAHRLQRAAHSDEATRHALAGEFLQFWQQDGQRHFCEEEQVLLPFFARYGDVEQEPIQQMLRDHILIRRDTLRLEEDPTHNPNTCRELGERLEAHVRLEERAVFPLIEAAVPDDALSELERRLMKFHARSALPHASEVGRSPAVEIESESLS
jgi:iron-sulfur cluster repair protein YtfE (RIC family)